MRLTAAAPDELAHMMDYKVNPQTTQKRNNATNPGPFPVVPTDFGAKARATQWSHCLLHEDHVRGAECTLHNGATCLPLWVGQKPRSGNNWPGTRLCWCLTRGDNSRELSTVFVCIAWDHIGRCTTWL
mmetsp:Transcript_97711/g.188467  ORF Transcript_97711/g.188467 Transcript_97711/m.188467 type:complete len:128 (+) Transcript_97711:754-1137(+)